MKVKLWQVNTAIETAVDVAVFGELAAPRVNLPTGVYGVSVEADDVIDLLKELAAHEWIVGDGPAEGVCDFCNAHRRVYFDGSHIEPHEEACIWRRARVILGMDVPA